MSRSNEVLRRTWVRRLASTRMLLAALVAGACSSSGSAVSPKATVHSYDSTILVYFSGLNSPDSGMMERVVCSSVRSDSVRQRFAEFNREVGQLRFVLGSSSLAKDGAVDFTMSIDKEERVQGRAWFDEQRGGCLERIESELNIWFDGEV